MTAVRQAIWYPALFLSGIAVVAAQSPRPAEWPVRPATPRSVEARVIAPAEFVSCQPDTLDLRNLAPMGARCKYSTIRGQTLDGRRIDLPSPLTLVVHVFADPIEASYAVELSQGQTPRAVFSHVIGFEVDAAGRSIALVRYVRASGGWRRQASVVTVATAAEIVLPLSNCTDHAGPIGSPGTITYGAEDMVCLWTNSGTMEASFQIPALERSGNDRIPSGSFGRLADRGLGIVMPSSTGRGCDVLLTSAKGQGRRFTIELPPSPTRRRVDQLVCAGLIDIDWSTARVAGGDLRYRVILTDTGSGPRAWGPWMTVR